MNQNCASFLCGILLPGLACLAADPPANTGLAPGKSIPLCAVAGDQQAAAISSGDSGLLVVWQDSRPDGKQPGTDYPWSLYGQHLQQGREFPIHVPPDADAIMPAVGGNTIAWMHNRGWSALLMTTLKDGQPGELKEIDSTSSKPSIDGNFVVWASAKNRHDVGRGDISWITDIRGFELNGPGMGFDVTNSDRLPQFAPAVSGSTVVWQELHAGASGWSSTFLRCRNIDRDAGSHRLAGIRDRQCENPAIDDPFVVWQDNRNGNWDIYGFDLRSGKELEICKGPGDQTNPAVHGSTVVWQDNRGGDWDIYRYNLIAGKTFPVVIAAHNQTEPDIYADVVVWTDDRGADKDIYATTLK